MFKQHSEFDADRIKSFSNRYQEILGIRALFKISAADLDKRYKLFNLLTIMTVKGK